MRGLWRGACGCSTTRTHRYFTRWRAACVVRIYVLAGSEAEFFAWQRKRPDAEGVRLTHVDQLEGCTPETCLILPTGRWWTNPLAYVDEVRKYGPQEWVRRRPKRS